MHFIEKFYIKNVHNVYYNYAYDNARLFYWRDVVAKFDLGKSTKPCCRRSATSSNILYSKCCSEAVTNSLTDPCMCWVRRRLLIMTRCFRPIATFRPIVSGAFWSLNSFIFRLLALGVIPQHFEAVLVLFLHNQHTAVVCRPNVLQYLDSN